MQGLLCRAPPERTLPYLLSLLSRLNDDALEPQVIYNSFMQVVVNNLLTEYNLSGSGKTVVLLHGWGDSMTGLDDLRLKLAKSFQVISLDLPGFGKSQTPSSSWGLDDYAKFVDDFLTKLALKADTIIGHSNGGAIAIRGLGRGILKSHRLVLLAASGIRGETNFKISLIRLVTKSGKFIVSPLPASIKKRLRQKVYKATGSDMLVAEKLQESFKKIIIDDVRADATNIKIPSLILYGREDVATPPKFGEIFHDLINNSKLEIIDSAGHFIQHDQPEIVFSLISDFIK